MRAITLFLILCCLLPAYSNPVETSELRGEWKGSRIVNAYVVNFNLHIRQTDQGYAATVDFPSQNNFNVSYTLKIKGNEFYLSRENKEGVLIEYKGKINGNTIVGTFHYNNEYMKDKPGIFQLMKSNAKYIKGEQLPDFELTTFNDTGKVSNSTYKGSYLLLDF
ncbi:hypothetical protein GWK08_05145 [Leptobacterium flavescens]|uniref:Lipocalin-like domain-containing protein n=1 Tax=Leptobacterium flavescens TaxID=472055 RepID=A0A6P0UHR1_9FLAO|nr:hypothetical protein [Leptobacterium flavescens]NER12815.1 hypothetical protein [Leptobacterium flavescens]